VEALRVCLGIEASANLNLFDGQPHVVVLYLYPLQNSTAFQASDPRDLVSGTKPLGLTGEPWEITVLPGQTLALDEPLPRDTSKVGIVADYYRGPRRVVASASCDDSSGAKLVLSTSDARVEN
jgi:type VI secretion system VasD/TssJ family lipoprotein